MTAAPAPSPVHLCAFAAAKANAGLPQSARFSTRAARRPHPRPRPRPRLPLAPRPPGPLVSPLWFKTPVDALWRVPARWRAAPRFSLQLSPGFLKKNPCGPPDPEVGRPGAAKAPSAALARGLARRPGRGRCHLGLAQGAVPKSVLPGKRSMETNRTAPLSPPAAERAPGTARASPQPVGPGPAPGPRRARRRWRGGRGAERPRAGARSLGVRAPAPRPLSLPGQCSFPRAREASQEVEVFPKAGTARRCPTRGWRGRRPRFLLLLLEAQPPKGFKKTLLHGVGAGCESPGFPFLKSPSWPKLLFLWLSGHVIDGGAGARSPAPPSHPSEPRCVGGGVPTWKAGDSGRLAARRPWVMLPTL